MPTADPTPATHRAVEAVWRIEAARLIADLARMVRDVGRAEDLAQDALVGALEQWPASGIPDNPGAWLMTIAKRRAVDGIRREIRLEQKVAEFGRTLETAEEIEIDIEEHVEDDVLRLMFTACHPVLTPPARAALTLKMLAALRTEETARAFLVRTPTMAQRIVRAKKTLTDARVPFEVPTGAQLAPRLASRPRRALPAVQPGLLGHRRTRPRPAGTVRRGDAAGSNPGRPRAGRARAHELIALMELQASRLRARTDASGEIVTLLVQDRARWDQLLIRRGLAALDRTVVLGGGAGTYAVQAAIAACHAPGAGGRRDRLGPDRRAVRRAGPVAPSPVIELNRAVAVSMADGPAAALELVDALVDENALARYHLLPAVRADLLVKLSRRTRPGPSSSGPPG